MIKRILVGAGVGSIVVAFFLVSAGGGNPEWGNFWMIRPIIVLIFAGSMAGLCNYIIMFNHRRFNVPKILAIILSGLVSLVGIWMGIVLGFNGTLWN
jgi:hypothetical protein